MYIDQLNKHTKPFENDLADICIESSKELLGLFLDQSKANLHIISMCDK